MTQDTKAPGIIKSVRKGENFPEKIHAHSAVVRFPNGVVSGNWQNQPDVETKEYVRAEVAERMAQAREAAALKKAAEVAANEADYVPVRQENFRNAILALITPDLQSALDSVVREAVLAEREACAQVVENCFIIVAPETVSQRVGTESNRATIAAAIRASTEGEGT